MLNPVIGLRRLKPATLPLILALSNFKQMQKVLNNSKDSSDDETAYLSGNLSMAETKVSFAAIGDLWETHRHTKNDVIRHNVTGSLSVLNAAQLKLWMHKESPLMKTYFLIGQEFRRTQQYMLWSLT